jgi:hypothetical protein
LKWLGWKQGEKKADRNKKAMTKWEKSDKKYKRKEVGNLTKDWLTENGSGSKNP